jgi:hypothetical protein
VGEGDGKGRNVEDGIGVNGRRTKEQELKGRKEGKRDKGEGMRAQELYLGMPPSEGRERGGGGGTQRCSIRN